MIIFNKLLAAYFFWHIHLSIHLFLLLKLDFSYTCYLMHLDILYFLKYTLSIIIYLFLLIFIDHIVNLYCYIHLHTLYMFLILLLLCIVIIHLCLQIHIDLRFLFFKFLIFLNLLLNFITSCQIQILIPNTLYIIICEYF